MAALLTDANKDTAQANTALTGDSSVLVSGNFSKNAQVEFTLEADSLTPYVWVAGPGLYNVKAKTGHTLRASIIGGDTTNTAVDVSVL